MRASPPCRESASSGSTRRAGGRLGPLGRRAAVVREREAAHEHRAGGRRPRGSSAGSSARSPRAPARARGAATSANRPGPRASIVARLAEPREDEAVAIGLLEAGEAVVGPPGAQNSGTEVELGRDRHGDRGERRPPVRRAVGERALRPGRAVARPRPSTSAKRSSARETRTVTPHRMPDSAQYHCFNASLDTLRQDAHRGVWKASDPARLQAGNPQPRPGEERRNGAESPLGARRVVSGRGNGVSPHARGLGGRLRSPGARSPRRASSSYVTTSRAACIARPATGSVWPACRSGWRGRCGWTTTASTSPGT